MPESSPKARLLDRVQQTIRAQHDSLFWSLAVEGRLSASTRNQALNLDGRGERIRVSIKEAGSGEGKGVRLAVSTVVIERRGV
ncbi:MAG: hypothetical protein HYY65_13880 [Candidatus Tectomicrobia bacterium]|uniref:Uncharacterized protein n=1 Tax=Tectimicrobiota bacterium TaxID=2528274 RepID=A0A932GSC5_UNCTE|nr:hypothetical protein [Candidatus Tectomicrobia bacterium]